MDIFFQDPSDIPLPPGEIRIRELRVEPLPDQRRVRLFIEITPFQKKPNLEIKVLAKSGEEAASLSIIEAIDRKMEFTVHLKRISSSGEYIASLEIYYFEGEFSAADAAAGEESDIHQLPEKGKPVDQRQVAFKSPAGEDAS
ncbi:MAG: hypothetical protein ACK2UE_03125 [Anaerolineales bacterium]|jgi:hypothetical protein